MKKQRRCGSRNAVLIFLISAMIAFAVLYGCVPLKYTVVFDSNGGTEAPSPINDIEGGTMIEAPFFVPVREGYSFDGAWYLEAECVNEWDFDTDTVNFSLTLYAGWILDGNDEVENPSNGQNGNTGGEGEDPDGQNENEAGDSDGNSDVNPGGDSEGNQNGDSNGENESADALTGLKQDLKNGLSAYKTECAAVWLENDENYAEAVRVIFNSALEEISAAEDTEAAQSAYAAAADGIFRLLKEYTAVLIADNFGTAEKLYADGADETAFIQERSDEALARLAAAENISGAAEAYENHLTVIENLPSDLDAAALERVVNGYIAQIEEFLQLLKEFEFDTGSFQTDTAALIEWVRGAPDEEIAEERFNEAYSIIESEAGEEHLGYFSAYYIVKLSDIYGTYIPSQPIDEIYFNAINDIIFAVNSVQMKNIYAAAVGQMAAAAR